MRIEGVLLGGVEALELVALAERARKAEPRVLEALGPRGRAVLAELNALALTERQRLAEEAFQAELVSVSEAARLSGMSARTIRRWAASGRIHCERRGGRWAVALGGTKF